MRYDRREHAAPRTPSIGRLPARPAAASLLLLAASLVLWVVSLGSIDVGQIGDVGLISVLPASFFAALLLLTMSFGVTLAAWEIRWLLMLQLAVLVVFLFGTPSFVEYGPRTQSAWRLAGVVDYISLHHSVNLAIDAFFNWPGFFILESFLTRAFGLSTPLAFARWAPLFFNLLYALPLALIFRRLSLSTRQVWIGLWLFFAANWVGQDYLAPQGFGYFVYLTIISLILTVFPASPIDLSLAGTLRLSARARTGLVALVLVLYALIVPSHQLTPWVLVFSLGALAVVRRLPSPGLPLLFCLMAATWVAFFAGPFLSGNFANLISPIGSVSSNVNANLGSRFVGNSGHLFVVRLRVVFSLAIGFLGLLGLLRLRRQGASIRILVALSIAPAVALVLQTYGGELSLRVFFFALPFIALAAGSALEPGFSGRSFFKPAATTVLLFVICIGFLVARYGNEKMDSFTKKEVAAVRFLYTRAPGTAVVVSANDNLPWKFEHYVDYTYVDLDQATVTSGSVKNVVAVMQSAPNSSYLLLTRSEQAEGELFDGWPSDTLAKFRSDLLRSRRFKIIFANSDSTLLKLRQTTRVAIH